MLFRCEKNLMKTLVQILTEKVQDNIPEKYLELDQIDKWTKDNRDSKIEDIRTLATILGKEGLNYLEFLNTTMHEGKSLMYWKIVQDVEASIIQFMGSCRENLDWVDIEDKNSAFDYEWINKVIREAVKKNFDFEQVFEKYELETNAKSEEI